MASHSIFSYRTRGNARPFGKPKVFFTCHPGDFATWFDPICEDLFRNSNCAVYYTRDPSAHIESASDLVSLERMNLLVVPVTNRLLLEASRAMDDVRLARKKRIPILPILCEEVPSKLYAAPENFGELQYLDKVGVDPTAIGYDTKLRDHLEAVLFDDKKADLIRQAFDARIFLSYRKKDRVFANELMRTIHSDPQREGIAIWFDEYLALGESFEHSIDENLEQSDLFALLVTPSVLEMTDGEPNYVMRVEYPKARSLDKPIVAVEMRKTDAGSLAAAYPGLPECFDLRQGVPRRRFLKRVGELARSTQSPDPMRDYLLGGAYLYGIDVERNPDKALQLIKSAAVNGLPAAMQELAYMYHFGVGVAPNSKQEIRWAAKLKDYNSSHYGAYSPESRQSHYGLAVAYLQGGQYEKACDLLEELYEECRVAPSETGPKTSDVLTDFVSAMLLLGRYEEALKRSRELLDILSADPNADIRRVSVATNNHAWILQRLGRNADALKLLKEDYERIVERYGDRVPHALLLLRNIAAITLALSSTDDSLKDQARSLAAKAYDLHVSVLGEEDQQTIQALSTKGDTLQSVNPKEALACHEKAYKVSERTLGASHPVTLDYKSHYVLSLCNAHRGLDDEKSILRKAIETLREIHDTQVRILGRDHRDTLFTLDTLGRTYLVEGSEENVAKARTVLGEAYAAQREVLGDTHPNTLSTQRLLQRLERKDTPSRQGSSSARTVQSKHAHEELRHLYGDDDRRTFSALYEEANAYYNEAYEKQSRALFQKTHDLLQETYERQHDLLGEDDPDTLRTLRRIAGTLIFLDKEKEAAEVFKRVHALQSERLGTSHPDTTSTQRLVENAEKLLEDLRIDGQDSAVHLSELDDRSLELQYEYHFHRGDYLEAAEIEVERCRRLPNTRATAKERADLLNSAGRCYGQGNKPDYALAVLEKAERLLLSIGERNSVNIHMNLASAYGMLGIYDKSLNHSQQAYVLSKKRLGKNDHMTLSALTHRCRALIELNRPDLPLTQECYDRWCETEGSSSDEACIALGMLGTCHRLCGDLDSALRILKQAYGLQVLHLGETNAITLSTYETLGLTYFDRGDFDKGDLDVAENILNELYKVRSKKLGAHHRDTLKAQFYLATIFEKRGNLKRALKLHRKIYRLRKKHLTAGDADTMQSLDALIALFSELGNNRKALRYQREQMELGGRHP